jgi:hypothetical protein
VLMGRDTAGEANESEAGNTGGFRWHGQSDEGTAEDNNHPNHKNHSHRVYTGGSDTVAADNDGNNAIQVYDTMGEVWTTGVDELKPDTDGVDFANHLGPFNAYEDTDNRMPFYVVITIERYK